MKRLRNIFNCEVMELQQAGALLHAVNFAAEKHASQRRKDPQSTPYINHPIGVAHLLLTVGQLEQEASSRQINALHTLQAAVLHDTVEDTETTPEEIESLFGAHVRQIVMECTDDKRLSKAERKQRQIETAPFKSREAKAVKLADKFYNLTDIQRAVPVGWSRERVQEYFQWAKQVVEGLRGTLPALEQKLDEVFLDGTFVFQGIRYPCLPKAV